MTTNTVAIIAIYVYNVSIFSRALLHTQTYKHIDNRRSLFRMVFSLIKCNKRIKRTQTHIHTYIYTEDKQEMRSNSKMQQQQQQHCEAYSQRKSKQIESKESRSHRAMRVIQHTIHWNINLDAAFHLLNSGLFTFAMW